jgi:hypothetical protein
MLNEGIPVTGVSRWAGDQGFAREWPHVVVVVAAAVVVVVTGEGIAPGY